MHGMKISELAARSGVPATTLRFYEAEGLLPAERAGNGYRVYGPAALDRLTFIGQAKHLDIPLSEVRPLVAAWESQPCRTVRSTYRPMLARRAEQVGERIVALEALRTSLVAALVRLDDLPDRHEPCDAGCSFLTQPHELPVVPVEASAPVACSLESGDLTERAAAWRELLRDAPRADVPGGVRATLPTARLAAAAQLAADEQRCCPFYEITLTLHGPTFDLTITAPPTAAGMLDALLPVPEDTVR